MSFSVAGLTQVWDQVLKVKRIDKILKILEMLDPAVSNTILRKFAKRMLHDNPLLYDELVKQMMNPLKVMEQLDRNDAGKVWKSIGLDDQEILASRIDSGLLYTMGINPDRYAEEIEISEKDYLSCVRRFYDSFYELQDQGIIRPLELQENHIRVPKCYEPDVMFEEKVRLVLKDTLLRRGDTIQLFMFREEQQLKACRLRLVQADDRSVRQLESETINFDAAGFAFWTSAAVKQTGMFEIFLEQVREDENEPVVLARTEILVVESASRCFSFDIHETDFQDGRAHVSGLLLYQNLPSTVDVSVQVVCGCGNVIDETWAHAEKGEFQLEADTGDHHGPFFILVSSMKSGIQGMIPLFEVSQSAGKPNGTVLKAPKLAKALNRFPLSIRHRQTHKLLNGILFAGGPTNLFGHISHQFSRPLQTGTFRIDQFNQLNQRLKNRFYHFHLPEDTPETQIFQVRDQQEWKETISFSTDKIPFCWRILFAQIHEDKRFSLVERTIPIPENVLSACFPKYVLPGDQIEGAVYHNTRKSVELEIVDTGNSSSRTIRKGGRVPIFITSESKLALQVKDDTDFPWQAGWTNQPLPQIRKGLTMRPTLLRKGDAITLNSGLLFPDLRHWILRTAVMMQSYPCRCAEQTSSIIGGLLIIRSMLDEGLSADDYTPALIDQLLQKEINHLTSMQHASGYLTLWRPSGDPPEYPLTPGLGITAFDNVKRLKEYSSSTGRQLFNKLKLFLKKTGKNPYTNQLEKSLLQYRVKGKKSMPDTELLQLIKENLVISTNRIGVFDLDPFKNDHYFIGVILELLHRMGTPKTHFVSAEKKLRNYEPGIIAALLDALHIRKRKSEIVVKKAYDQTDDPILLILQNLMQRMGASGYWGTSSTVRILESLLLISKQRAFQGSFEIEGHSKPVSPDEITEIENKKIRVLSDEAIIAATYKEDTIDTIMGLERLPSGITPGGIALSPGNEGMQLGNTCPLTIDLADGEIPHPMVDIYQSGFLQFDSFTENAAMDGHHVTLAANQKMDIPVTAIRRGKGHLLCKISDMYDPYLAYRTEVPVEIS